MRSFSVFLLAAVIAASAFGEEPTAFGEEPSAKKEPSARNEPSAKKEPSAGQQPAVGKKPSADPASSADSDLTTHNEQPSVEEESSNDGWLDTGRKIGARSGDAVARWLDDFWDDTSAVEEAPHSKLRLRLGQEFWEGGEREPEASLRGKLHLPKLSNRLSLLFSDDDLNQDEVDGDPEGDLFGDIYLQYKGTEDKKHRVDYKLGLSSELHIKAAAKYRYQDDLVENWRLKFVEQLSYHGEEGFELGTDASLSWLLSSDQAIRLSQRFNWGESTDGVEWYSSLSFNRKIEDNRSLSYFIFATGETRPEYLNQDYGLGVKYRRSFYRPWLFFELQPIYGWQREEVEDRREGRFRTFFRVEMFFTD